MIKFVFGKMVANVTCLHTSHLQTAQDIINLVKGPDPCYPVSEFSDMLSTMMLDMEQNVILQGYDHKRMDEWMNGV